MFEKLVGLATIASGFAAVATLLLVLIDRLKKPRKPDDTQ